MAKASKNKTRFVPKGIIAGMDKFVVSARMNQYERGVHTPDFKTIIALSGVLKLPTAFFFCIEGELAEKILNWIKLN